MKNLSIKVLFVFVLLCIFAMSISAACHDEAKKTDNWTQALSDCKRAVDANPGSVEARISMIEYAEKLRLWNIAISELLEVIKIEEKNPDLYLEVRFEWLGKLLALKGDSKNALLAYLKAASLAENGAEKYLIIAKVLEENVKSGFKAEMKEDLDEAAIKADEVLLQELDAKTQRGSTLKEALKEINKVLTRRPFLPKAVLIRGKALRSSAKYADALKDFELAVKLKPWEGAANYELASQLNSSLFPNTKYDECIEAATRAIGAYDGFRIQSFLVRGGCREAKGDKEKAIEDYFEAKSAGYKDRINNLYYLLASPECGSGVTSTDAMITTADNYKEKKIYRCAVLYYTSAFESKDITPKGKSFVSLKRGLAYLAWKPDSFNYTELARRDFIYAAYSGHASPEDAAKAHLFLGETHLKIAESFSIATSAKTKSYESALESFDNASKNLPAEFATGFKTDNFVVRCAFAKHLMRSIPVQKGKNRTNFVAKLTEKLNASVAKIEADFKVYSQDNELAAGIGADYIKFALEYEEFKKLK